MFISNKKQNIDKNKNKIYDDITNKNKQYLPTTYNCIKSEIRRKK
ncbi:hypothetical protein SAG0134_05995 [Streptococcus agalactiae LMG 14608]|nr:hypothetical protein SAG0134_05995 [Streptococcus agalactiae LMG 14608]